MLVDMRSWAKLNLWPLASGEMAVRPGLRRVLAPDSQRMFCGGFSILNPFTGEVWSYVFDCTSSVSANRDLRLRIYDEDWQIFQTFSLNVNVDPRVVSHAVVEGQILICSPDFPTLFGLVGSSVRLALKVASDNPSTTAIDIPRGIVANFCNRMVIADGPSLFFSDPIAATGGDARTFVAQNQNQRPAPIFGLHEGAGGALVVLTQRGVYGLDASAAAVGIVGSNGTDWRVLNHTETASFASSASVDGRVYVLTKKGYMLADVEDGDEEHLSDPMLPRTYGPRIASDDWRSAMMFAGEYGPVVSSGDAVSMHDLDEGVRSWWRCNVGSTFRVRGLLDTPDGAKYLLCEDGVYEACGNFDGDTTSVAANTQPKGVLVGRVMTEPSENYSARKIDVLASLGGEGSIRVSVRGKTSTAIPPADARSLVIGTSLWGASSVIYQPAPLAHMRWDNLLNSHDVGVEVAADFAETRIGVGMNADQSESAKTRPTNRGQG